MPTAVRPLVALGSGCGVNHNLNVSGLCDCERCVSLGRMSKDEWTAQDTLPPWTHLQAIKHDAILCGKHCGSTDPNEGLRCECECKRCEAIWEAANGYREANETTDALFVAVA
jgi:hypothetical protein